MQKAFDRRICANRELLKQCTHRLKAASFLLGSCELSSDYKFMT